MILYAAENATQVALDAIQILGKYGHSVIHLASLSGTALCCRLFVDYSYENLRTVLLLYTRFIKFTLKVHH